jgi:Fe-S oxidoreductase
VNLALLKAEMLYARHQRDGLPLRERIFSSVDLMGRIGCATPRFANAIVDLAPVRALMEKALGISAKRSMPHYASERFDRWFAKHCSGAHTDCRSSVSDATAFNRMEPRGRERHGRAARQGERAGANESNALQKRGKVILWDDTFVRYHEPQIGIAAVKVLEALGFEVSLVKNRECCGRPAFSQGNLDAAAKLGKHNVDLLNSTNASPTQTGSTPIIFLEPSCWSMFVDDYRELKIDNVEKVAARCFLFEKFIDDLLDREPDALQFKNGQATVVIHPHCHAKSLMNPAFMAQLVERLPGRKATLLDTGCCGMAGAFGALAEKYELSVQVAAHLIDKIDNQHPDVVVASGTSCRHQIADLTNTHPKHMAELIAEAIA